VMKTITFTSDFGTSDWFTAAVKGEIFKIAGDVRIVDITHNIAPFDVRGAAFLLFAVYNNFPKGTIHLAVIDPGVGGKRKPIIVDSLGHYFVGPDNGLFSYIYTAQSEVYTINVSERVSQTFHARDIFGPAAARLATGIHPRKLGKKLCDYEQFAIPRVSKEKGRLRGEIAYIDHFGNCITNVQNNQEISEIRVSGHHISVERSYSDVQVNELACVRGSTGYYEIAAYHGNACKILQAKVGMPIEAS
jgi:S-adenosylmethionine hydrolase